MHVVGIESSLKYYFLTNKLYFEQRKNIINP